MFRALISTLVISVATASILIAACPNKCLAQGIIGKMEADGTWAKYKYTLTHYSAAGEPTEDEMVVIMRCVGSKYIDMEAYRWIEIEIPPREEQKRATIFYKMLFKESDLAKGKVNLENAAEFWHTSGQKTGPGIVKIEDLSTKGSLADWFFPLPAKNVKQLDAKTIETALGEYKCRGIYWEYGGEGEIRSAVREHTAYYNDESPFGLVSFECKQRNNSGKPTHNVGLLLVLDSHGVGAKSAHPDIK